MPVEYEWHFDEKGPGGETEGTGEARPSRRRVWSILAVAAVVLVGFGLYAWWRVSRVSLRRMEEEVQAVARLEMRALADEDAELYLSLQDDSDPRWQELQEARLISGTALPAPAPGLAASVPFAVEHPRVIGDHARVELVRMAGLPGGASLPFRAARFYRLTSDGRWLHTSADQEYAGRMLVWVGPRNDLAGFSVEDDLLGPLAPELEVTAARFCDLFSCESDVRFRLAFTSTLDTQTTQPEVLPAPHIVGVPDDDAARAVWTQAVKGYLVELMLDQVVGVSTGGLIETGLRTRVREMLGVAVPRQPDLDLLAQAAAEGRLPTLSALWERAVPDEQRTTAESEVILLLNFIEEEYGSDRLPALLMTGASSLDATIGIALGTDLPTFERQWLTYLHRRVSEPAYLRQGAPLALAPRPIAHFHAVVGLWSEAAPSRS